MDKIRFGLVGTGNVVRECHLPALRKNPRVEIAAACDVFLKPGVPWEGIAKTFTDFNNIASDPEIDAVLIAAPNNIHAEVAVKMLQTGKHVLCEKPMAISGAEAKAMVDAAAAAGRKLVVGHPWRCDQDFGWIRELVRSGRLGKVFKIRGHCVLAQNFPPLDSWRLDPKISGGGILMDVGMHAIDTVFYLFDDKIHPIRAFAKIGNNFTNVQVEDTATVVIEFDNGMTFIIDAGWHHKFQNSPHGALELFGTEGYARAFPTELHTSVNGAWGIFRPELHPDRPHIDLSMYIAQIDAFVDCVLGKRDAPCDGKMGLRNVILLEAVFKSARTGESVKITDV